MEESKAEYNQYFRDYRQKKGDHLRNLEKVKYWKKKGLTEDFIKKYGEYAGEVFKIKALLERLADVAPDLSLDEIVAQTLPRGVI